jgi:DNA-directed RNA polymerase sigma subunit (sigma70/sigma32)
MSAAAVAAHLRSTREEVRRIEEDALERLSVERELEWLHELPD